MPDSADARRTMVDRQVRTYDVTDRAVIAALLETPREPFVPAGREALTYSDQAIPLRSEAGSRRSLLPPMILARLLQALDIRAGATVLDVGCATGYSTLLLDRLGAHVVGLEPDSQLADGARARLARLGSERVSVVIDSVVQGHAAGAPYDAILLNGAFEITPEGLIDQLSDQGRLVGIDASGRAPKAVLIRRAGQGSSRQTLFDAAAPVFEDLRRTEAFAF